MTKAELRKLYKEKRRFLTPKELETRSSAVIEHFFSKFDVVDKMISIFLPIEKLKEINTYSLVEKAVDFGAKIALSKSNLENHTMRHFVYDEAEGLEINAFGIPEPKKGKPISADKIDIVIVPLLTYDKKGNRVGYGKGYYDRFLQKCSPLCQIIGVSVFEEFEQISDVEKTDVPLTAIVTPAGVTRFSKK
jgi:5-formyltetrahydrofolate cyclo-ligase